MADLKISQLTAKGSAIANTDLLEISESDGAGGYVTKSVTGANIIGSKQDTLISGTNIKTINSTTILGSGNLAVQPTLVSSTNIKTINSTTLLGSGDLTVQPTLVSGTNIKTINSNSILGSGDLVITGGVSSVSATTPVVATGTTTPVISLASNYGDTLNPYSSKTANNILAAPNGTAGVPTFRAIVGADIPTLNQNTTGTASNVTGIVAVANGGTGTATPSLVAGTNVTITGTFPNQTIAASGAAGAVTQIVAGTNVTISPAGGTGVVTINASGGGGGLLGIQSLLPLASGDVTCLQLSGFGGFTQTNLVNDRIALFPYTPNQTIISSSLDVTVNNIATGSNCKILIYSNLNGLPDTKIYESASLDGAISVGIKTAITSQTFTAGTIYWVGLHGQNGAAMMAINSSQSVPLKIAPSGVSAGLVSNTIFKDVTFGSAPANFGVPTGFLNMSPYLIRITKA